MSVSCKCSACTGNYKIPISGGNLENILQEFMRIDHTRQTQMDTIMKLYNQMDDTVSYGFDNDIKKLHPFNLSELNILLQNHYVPEGLFWLSQKSLYKPYEYNMNEISRLMEIRDTLVNYKKAYKNFRFERRLNRSIRKLNNIVNKQAESS